MIRVGISKKGQVTLPAEVRKHLNIKPKSHVYFVIENDGVRVIPAKEGIESLKGILSASGPQDFKKIRHRAMEEITNERASRTVRD